MENLQTYLSVHPVLGMFIGGIFTIIGLAICVTAGYGCAQIKERERAVESVVGRWFIDERTGKKEFRYGTFPENKRAQQQPENETEGKALEVNGVLLQPDSNGGRRSGGKQQDLPINKLPLNK